MQKAICPICSSQKYKVLYEEISLEEPPLSIVKKGEIYKNILCKNCKILWTPKTLSDTEILKSYDIEFNNTIESNIKYDNSRQKELDFIARKINQTVKLSNKKLLDIGAFYGQFISIAKKYGALVSAADISRNGLKYINENITSDVYQCQYLTELKLQEESFSVITSFETIEHISNPLIELKEIFRLLKKDGMLFIAVPSSGYIKFKTILSRFLLKKLLIKIGSNKNRLLLVHSHFFSFSPKSIKILLNKAGFKSVKIMVLKRKTDNSKGFLKKLLFSLLNQFSQLLYIISFGRIVISISLFIIVSKN